ncbi:MAG: hypothetical protein L6Q71_01440 [Planctomycetes bacterium]|nr:hypothetical protein [Planctomycetota bacterium]NUQ35934.1 hypothetical protein [Planctomycetaceae bacterium]
MAKGKKPPAKPPKPAKKKAEPEDDIDATLASDEAELAPEGDEAAEEEASPEFEEEDAPPARSAPPPRGPRKSMKVAKPSQPAQTDKFGIALLSLVLLLLIANIFVWDKAGAGVDFTMMNRKTAQEYNLAISPSAKIVAYESRGVLAKMPGEVDTVLLDKGYRQGVKKGDIFRSEKFLGNNDQFVEFSVFEVGDSYARAWIILGTTWSERGTLRLTESIISNIEGLKPDSTVLRAWESQEVRNIVQKLAEG